MSSTPFPAPDPEPRSNAMIGKSVKVNGKIFTKEDLVVDGDVEGTIESAGQQGHHRAERPRSGRHRSPEVIILGQVQGNVIASDKVDIRKDAKLVGDIVAARISIEDGALFKGSIDIKKPEPKASTPTPAPSSPAAHPPTPPVAVGAGGTRT